MSDWISVKDKLPEYEIEVLVFSGNDIDIAMLHDNSHIDMPDNWYNRGCWDQEPTHWMPLPPLPEVSNNQLPETIQNESWTRRK